ncbi:hypothetical protein like AT3G24255 [Hibiscus trionum]|uniref:Reverse transcriptase zinc-binding domain-containing protein n=1 Tax=Hibiscus trionum TaxID=183268 RepID=A0A9W7MJR2_HIBTR|nr:hypothetical protein like AT3G24255 [Hibiscus trionum]
MWQPILDKFSSRLEGWSGKLLSIAGRLCLIKSVLCSLPIYYLGMFLMPNSVADKLNSLIAKFLWGPNSNRPIHWIKWNNLVKPKEHGGLGFFDLRLKNRALLNKWIWRYSVEPDSLWRKIIDAKYDYEQSNLVPKPITNRYSSRVWRNILLPLQNSNDLFSSNLCFVLGDGKAIQFWDDYWTEVPSLRQAFPRIFSIALRKRGCIADFGSLVAGKWEWSIELRRTLFDWEVNMWSDFVDTIDRAAKYHADRDCLRWSGSTHGFYKPKDYCVLVAKLGNVDNNPIWKLIWQNLAPPKVEIFLWRAVQNRILTCFELGKRGISGLGNSLCPFCVANTETSDHLLCQCIFTWQVWQKWCHV